MNQEIQEIERARKISSKLKPSRKWEHLRLVGRGSLDGCPLYENNIYTVTARHFADGWPFGGGEWKQLGIYCEDGEARHDFRDFQNIKNDICGEDWEAIELYPAESRLLDPSNYYMLWCAPKINIGINKGRTIACPKTCTAPQRGWSPGSEPIELRKA